MNVWLRSLFTILIRTSLCVLVYCPPLTAHDPRPPARVIVDTDCALDDLRALTLILADPDLQVLALTTTTGALTAGEGLDRVRTLLREFRHEGVPSAAGRELPLAPPEWREFSRALVWGAAPGLAPGREVAAAALMAECLSRSQERVTIVCLGGLTNLADLLNLHPEIAVRIERVVWYNRQAFPPEGTNYRADPLSADQVLRSGLAVQVVSNPDGERLVLDAPLLKRMSALDSPGARNLVRVLKRPEVQARLQQGHLKLWDDLAAVFLARPGLFAVDRRGPVAQFRLTSRKSQLAARQALLDQLAVPEVPKCQVFAVFPAAETFYAPDVRPRLDAIRRRHGPVEFRAAVLANEIHGHLGIYAIVGVKMGIRAREYFRAGVDGLQIASAAGARPPLSCLNDGLQVSTGGTLGHGLIELDHAAPAVPAATFTCLGRKVRITLKQEYAARVGSDIQEGIRRHGDLSGAYWQYVRELAIRYWLEFDRAGIFELEPLN
mgnify:CR=1 FL=1